MSEGYRGAAVKSIDNSEDIIDSRDVIERLAELAGQWAAHQNDPTEPELDENELEEMKALTALAEDGEDYSEDWAYGATLVRDSYFEEYARELADDLGLLNDNDAWPARCIDWEKAADELRQDYTSVEFDGITYWVR